MYSFSIDLMRPRTVIEKMIVEGDVRRVLEMAGMLHGHYCPGLALGVKAAYEAFKRLEINGNTGMEEIMAVAECNNCFVDGIQFAAGCSFGNNSLVYKDLGKTAATFYRRGAGNGVRISVKAFDAASGSEEERREGDSLFEKAVKRREKLTDEENRRLKELWIKRSFLTLEMPAEKIFSFTNVNSPELPFAPILNSVECNVCGEKVMESRTVFSDGKQVCITCAGEEYRMVVGKGIKTCGAVRQ